VTAAGTQSRATRKAPARKRKRAAAIVVPSTARRSLVEDVAFFHAARYRALAPGDCRAEDRCAAEAEIKAILKKKRKRSP
jgi:hypothetical protein